LLGSATEEMSLSLGQTLAGLLNATFGNAVEVIVGLVALLKGEVRIVQTSVCNRPYLRTTHVYHAQMLGSILSNILLVLGCSFLAGMIDISVRRMIALIWWHRAGGIVNHESTFRVTAAQTLVLPFFLR